MNEKPPPKHTEYGNYQRADWFECHYEAVLAANNLLVERDAAHLNRIAELQIELDEYKDLLRTRAQEADGRVTQLEAELATVQAALVQAERELASSK